MLGSSVFSGSSSYKPKPNLKKSLSTSLSSSSVPAEDRNCAYLGTSRSVERFERMNRIGEGTYGIVYRARDRDTNEIVALKRVRMENEKNGLPVTSLREINTLKACEHPNVIRLYDVVVGGKVNSMFLVFEYAENDLARILDEMRDEHPFTESEIKCLMTQLLNAVSFLHDSWIIHRDIKMSNLLYTRRGVLKVGDFGLARFVGSGVGKRKGGEGSDGEAESRKRKRGRRGGKEEDEEEGWGGKGKEEEREENEEETRGSGCLTPTVITLWYRPPELLLGEREYDEAIDMWSVGCIMGELLSGKPLFPGKSELDQFQRMFDLLGVPSEKIWPGMKKLPGMKKIKDWGYAQPYNNISEMFKTLSPKGQDLLDQLLTYDPKKRINSRRALQHPYFRESPIAKTPEVMPTFPSFHIASEEESKKRRPRVIARAPSPKRKKKGTNGDIFENNAHRYDLHSQSLSFISP